MNRKRTVINVFPAMRKDIGDLTTYRALPTQWVGMQDPFLFLNHHGPQVYAPHNRGLPFGPHPHRGFETVTFILDGDIAHRDSAGHESVIDAGGIQWMTAGRGLVHSEHSSQRFMREGGPLEILQLWLNLPARLKMTEPRYIGLQKEQIPIAEMPDGAAQLQLIAGQWNGTAGAVRPLTDVSVMLLHFAAPCSISMAIPSEHAVFLYVVRGNTEINKRPVEARRLAQFASDGDSVDIAGTPGSVVLLCHAPPYNEPIAAHGPFVMNTEQEIRQAILDYQAGKF
ncbi:pirin family protein [Oxalobacteraceae bacterium R-40]|uniref:Pirin family protein n=1 Tax=Keguizhuia sedimenti TaxID=3064264 RepID=A0ABU1BK00_9BURK|nr:pirin family protein [Oxalobacteraceae bacterium R-40]